MVNPYSVIAFYAIKELEDPAAEENAQRSFLANLDARCRIYLSQEGINGQLSIVSEQADLYIDWLRNRPYGESLSLKIDEWHDHAFPRLQIKVRPQLVAAGEFVDLSQRGTTLSPRAFKELMELENSPLLIDVRNRYETVLGHFEKAILPPCETFRDFSAFAQELVEKEGKNRPYAMCCTGGIRCEYFSSILKGLGVQDCFQLEGGLIQYGKEVGSDHFVGSVFVFDDRMSVPIDGKKTMKTIASCLFCDSPTDHYYNCANTDCNELFLACFTCLTEQLGCCSKSCQGAERRRDLRLTEPHRPFRKNSNLTH